MPAALVDHLCHILEVTHTLHNKSDVTLCFLKSVLDAGLAIEYEDTGRGLLQVARMPPRPPQQQQECNKPSAKQNTW